MGFPRNVYGIIDREAPGLYEADRLAFIARVRSRRAQRLAVFRAGLRRAVEDCAVRPGTIVEGREFVRRSQADGRIAAYPLGGDRWLVSEFGRAGLVLSGPIQRARIGCSDAQDRLLRAWAAECLRRRDPEEGCALEYFAENLFRWAESHEREEEIEGIGSKRLAAWLRGEGHKSVRRASGIVFLGLAYRRPVSDI